MWRINLVENNLEISKECAEELMKIEDTYSLPWDDYHYGEDAWPTENYGQGGNLFFDMGAYEHMDYVWNEDVQAILLKHKVNGQIIFNSFDGDNSGKAWGYVFNDGVCTEVKGSAKTMKLKPIKLKVK
jgi:hypothetical protein